MELIKMHASVDKQGRIILPEGCLEEAGLKPGDEVNAIIVAGQEEGESLCSQLLITLEGIGIVAQLAGVQAEDEECELTLPNNWLEAAEIPIDSDLEISCMPGAIIITGADMLDGLPDELKGLFEELGIDPGTVREVMREEGFFV